MLTASRNASKTRVWFATSPDTVGILGYPLFGPTLNGAAMCYTCFKALGVVPICTEYRSVLPMRLNCHRSVL